MNIDAQDPSPRDVRVLTQEIAESMGHIAWIEETDPTRAFQRMMTALQTAPINCAVWADANRKTKRKDLKILANFRRNFDFMLPHQQRFGNSITADKSTMDRDLSHFFNQLNARNFGIPGMRENVKFLEKQARLRAAQIMDAFPALSYTFNLRADFDIKTLPDPNPHTDGSSFGNLRILENLASPGTCIFENYHAEKQVQSGDHFITLPPGQHDPRARYRLKENANPIFWQVPENSLTMITNHAHPWQPILHSEAPTPPEMAPTPRTLLVYDLFWVKKAF